MIEPNVLHKERVLGEVVSDAFAILFARWRTLAVLVAPSVVVTMIISLTTYLLRDMPTLEAVASIAAFPAEIVVSQLAAAMIVVYLDGRAWGRLTTPSEALRLAEAKAGSLIGALLRSVGIIFLLSITVVGIPWAIKRLVKWLFVVQVVMLEHQTGEAVLQRSAEIVQGRWWATLGRLIVTGLVLGVPLLTVSAALAAALPQLPALLLGDLLGLVTTPFGIIATTLVYYDLKARKASHAPDLSASRLTDTEQGASG